MVMHLVMTSVIWAIVRHLLKINTKKTTTLILNPEKTKLHRQVGYKRLGGRNVVG